MARKRRSMFRKGRTPGKTFWLRPPAFSVALVGGSSSIYSTIILDESDFQEPSTQLNDTKAGAPILERIVCELGYAQQVSDQYLLPAGFNQVTMHFEMMMWVQSDQFASIVVNGSTFDDVLANERILGYAVADFSVDRVAGSQVMMSCRQTFAPRTKVRLREAAVGVAMRGNFDVADASVLSTFPWVQPTMLVRQP